eukprot:gene9060-1156_t
MEKSFEELENKKNEFIDGKMNIDKDLEHFCLHMNKKTMEKHEISRGDIIHLKNDIFQTVLLAVPNFTLSKDQFVVNETIAFNLNLKNDETFQFSILEDVKSISKLFLRVNKQKEEKEKATNLLRNYFQKNSIPIFTGNVFHLNLETEEIPWIQTTEVISTFIFECDKLEWKNEEIEKGIVLKSTEIILIFGQ